MPQSPATTNYRYRSESYDTFSSYKSKRTLFSPRERKKISPDSVDYWLPLSYEELLEDEDSNQIVSEIHLSFESPQCKQIKGKFDKFIHR